MEKYLMQMVMGCIGAVGFAVLFNVRGRKLIAIAIASALSWWGYAGCMLLGGGVFWGLFWGTAVAAVLSEVLARLLKAPVLMLLVPILIPLIPGGDLYHMMACLVRGMDDSFVLYARSVLTEAGSIALGIISASTVMRIYFGLGLRIKEKRERRSQ